MRVEINVFQLENLRSCLKNFGDNLGCWLKKIFKKGIVPKISLTISYSR